MNTGTAHEETPQVTVYSGATQLETEMVRGSLMAAGIPAFIGEQVTEAYAPLLESSRGFWGTIIVPASFEEQAYSIIRALESGNTGVSDAELESAALDSYDPRV